MLITKIEKLTVKNSSNFYESKKYSNKFKNKAKYSWK